MVERILDVTSFVRLGITIRAAKAVQLGPSHRILGGQARGLAAHTVPSEEFWQYSALHVAWTGILGRNRVNCFVQVQWSTRQTTPTVGGRRLCRRQRTHGEHFIFRVRLWSFEFSEVSLFFIDEQLPNRLSAGLRGPLLPSSPPPSPPKPQSPSSHISSTPPSLLLLPPTHTPLSHTHSSCSWFHAAWCCFLRLPWTTDTLGVSFATALLWLPQVREGGKPLESRLVVVRWPVGFR